MEAGNIQQIGLILLLIVPGYICYSLKEMWVSHREKGQFEKFLNSLVYSIIIWIVFYVKYENTPRYYLMEGKIPDLLWCPAIFILVTIIVIALSIKTIEQRKYLFSLGKTNKSNRNVPLLEDFISTCKKISFIEVETNDGCVYRGISRKKGDIILSSHPYSGDVLFVCNYFKDSDGNETKFDLSQLYNDKNTFSTYIPKESIKTIRVDSQSF